MILRVKKGFHVVKRVADPDPVGSASFWRIQIGMALLFFTVKRNVIF
jgi:hypothetical protein